MYLNELYEIPYRSELCYQKNKGIILPEDVPYIGMGASHIATTVFRYLGISLFAETAADYYNYLLKTRKLKKGVLISQSGHSSETLWSADGFSSFTAIVNDANSPLVKHAGCEKSILLYSGTEDRFPSKTYLNTMLVLYMGFGYDPREVIQTYKNQLTGFESIGMELGECVRKRINGWKKKSIYILGNGPNIATAELGALVLSAAIKRPVHSMSVSEYDHGFKDTAQNALVIAINHEGPEARRTKDLLRTIEQAGGEVFVLSDPLVHVVYSPLTFPLFFFFAAEYLLDRLKMKSVFQVGKKITTVDHPSKDEH